MIYRDYGEQNAFAEPNQYFSNQQCDKIILKENTQHNPEENLRDQVSADTGQQDASQRPPAPETIAHDDNTLQEECDGKSDDQFVLERRMKKITNPMTTASPITAQRIASMTVQRAGETTP